MTVTGRGGALRGLFALILTAILWGTVPIATNTLYRSGAVTPIVVAFFRLALALPVLLPALWLLPAPRLPEPADRRIFLIFGLALAAYQLFYFAAILRLGVTLAALVNLCSLPIIVALLEALLLRVTPPPRVLAALFLALTGTVLLVAGPRSTLPVAGGFVALLPGLLLALAAATSFAVALLAGRAVSSRYHPLQPLSVGALVGALVLLPFALAQGVTWHYAPGEWLLLAYNGLLPTAFAYLFFFYGLRTSTATVAGIVNLVEPLTTTLLAWILFGERLGVIGLLGAFLLLSAMGILTWGAQRRTGIKKGDTALAVPPEYERESV